jgi:FixJ family two-component response regulator
MILGAWLLAYIVPMRKKPLNEDELKALLHEIAALRLNNNMAASRHWRVARLHKRYRSLSPEEKQIVQKLKDDGWDPLINGYRPKR